MNEPTETKVTLKIDLTVEKQVTIQLGPNDNLQDEVDKEADKLFFNSAEELAYEELDFININDVQPKDLY